MNYSESNKNALRTCLCREKAPKVRVTEFNLYLFIIIYFLQFLTLPVLFPTVYTELSCADIQYLHCRHLHLLLCDSHVSVSVEGCEANV